MKSSTGADAVLSEAGACAILGTDTRDRDFDRLLATNGPALARLASSYTNTLSDRDDLLQEIALAVWQALRQFRGECSERTFLFRIAHNRAVAYLARTKSRIAEAGEDIEVHDPAPDPESGLLQEQRAVRLRRAIHLLPLVYRQIITLALEGMAYGEIAEVLGISESNVGARLTRARQLLREQLEKQR
jgi:RNA polymerase sigma factor (sigma-70 family)